jgi:hypothetical protein
MNRLPHFHIKKETQDYIFIQDDYSDDNPCPTVTNAVENVVECLSDKYNLGTRRLYYQDTEGQIDELVHENGTFKCFSSGHEDAPELI